MQIMTLLKNKIILYKLLKEYDIKILDTKNTIISISYLCPDLDNSLINKLKESFQEQTNHPLIIL